MRDKPVIWLVAGADGVGKTTYAFRHIRAAANSARFVSLDEIARGLSPLDPEAERREAGRIALARFDAYVRRDGTDTDFSLETTLAGLTYLPRLRRAKARGWRVHLLYLAVATPEVAQARIARRVAEGGHGVSDADALRRFERSLANLPRYLALADSWRVFDNNGAQPRVEAAGRGGRIGHAGRGLSLPPVLSEMLGALPSLSEG